MSERALSNCVSTLLVSGAVLGSAFRCEAAAESKPTTPVEVTPDARSAAESSNHFAVDLYQQLRDRPGNLFFSPASIATALAMTYGGAEGRTEEQMAQVLALQGPEVRVHDGFGTLGNILNSEGKGFQLRMANRLWGQRTYPFRPEFLELTRERYGAGLEQLDFSRSEQARQAINRWVSEQTAGKIADLIPPRMLDEMTRLVLTNAIYFKGGWQDEFSTSATQDAAFHLTAQRQVMVPTMRQTDDFRYGESERLQVLELPYAGRDLSMVILLPKKVDGVSDVEEALAPENLRDWTDGLRRRKVRVFLPRFKMTSQFKLAETLSAMGMTLAFSRNADFSGMSSVEDLMLTEVVHKAFVDVNEQGTEAAAATGIGVAVASAPLERPEEPVVFRADHPFLFLIRDNRTGAILFLGRVSDPRE